MFEGWKELLEPIVADLPDLSAALHLHDGPHSILEWALSDAYNTLVEHGRCESRPDTQGGIVADILSSWERRNDPVRLPLHQQPRFVRRFIHRVLEDADARSGRRWTVRERTCDPQSPFRRENAGTDAPMPGLGPAFVQSATLAMQYCLDPSIRRLHGPFSDCFETPVPADSFERRRCHFRSRLHLCTCS